MRFRFAVSVSVAVSVAVFTGSLLAQEPQVDLPRQEGAEEETYEVEPPLLIDDMSPEPLDLPLAEPTPVAQDIEKLELQLKTAQRRATAGERLFKAGVLAKVESEARTLKAIKIEADLELARFDRMKEEVTQLEQRLARREIASVEAEAARTALQQAELNAKSAAEKRRAAEVEIAQLNVQRQKKLLASGVGRKIDVKRAEEKLAALKQQQQQVP